jgi:signal transduction histidine kinase/ligand-binding sensor domain-containing protein
VYQIGQTLHIAKLNKDLFVETVFSYTDTQSRFFIDSYTVFIPFKEFCLIGDNHLPIHYFGWDGTLLKKEVAERNIDSNSGENVRRYIDEFTLQDGTAYVMLYRNPTLHLVNEETMTIDPVKVLNNKLPSENLKIANDTLGNAVWVTTINGKLSVQTYYNKKGFITIFEKELFDTSKPFKTLSNNLTKELWVGRNNGELHYLQFPSQTVKTFLPNYEMRAITALDTANILVATEKEGWFTINLIDNTEKPFRITEKGIEIKPNSSRGIYKEGNTLWSNDGGSIMEVDLASQRAKRYRHYPVISLQKATDSTFIYGTNGYALMEFNKNTKEHKVLVNTKDYIIYGLANHDSLWVAATDKGVLTFNTLTKESNFYDADVLEDPYLLMATYHPQHGFLLGSRSGHMYHFDPQTKIFTTLYKDALQAGIATILFKNDTWWINTFNGVVAFNPKIGSVKRYSEKDGFSHNEANRYSAFDTGNGFVLGSIEGLNYFSPEALSKEDPKWELILLNTKLYDAQSKTIKETTNTEALKELKTIILPQENKMLSLDFALTHNVGGREHSFRYRLNNDDWVDLKEQQSISFPNLAAGNYILEIEAKDFSGNSIGKPLLYRIYSKDFFYNQWWFYLLLLLAGFGIALYFLWQSSQKRKMQEQFSGALLVSQEEERTRIAKELHDSIGQQLTLIKRKAQHEDKEEIASLSHKTLEEVRSISRGLYPAFLKQLGLSESIEQLILEIDEDTSLFCTAEIDDIDSYFSNDENLNFYRFIQECVNNSLKHAEATNLSIKVKDMPNKVLLQIKDNGKGFDVSEAIKNKSLGLKTLKERIRLLHGTMQIQSSVTKGTLINCEIPKK